MASLMALLYVAQNSNYVLQTSSLELLALEWSQNQPSTPNGALRVHPSTAARLESPTPPPTPVDPPFDCPALLTNVRSGKSGIVDPNKGNKNYTIRTANDIPFYISLYDPDYDPVRAIMFQTFRYYESALDTAWEQVLRGSPSGSRVLDVGGNIGYHSLLSASLGKFHVDSFEPKLENILRFCESLERNGWASETAARLPSVNIHDFGVSDVDNVLRFYPDQGNPGAGKFVASALATKDPSLAKRNFTELKVQTLDTFVQNHGWFVSKPNIAILKIDVERHEAQVVLGATKLLQSALVQNIFVETSLDGLTEGESPDRQALQTIMDAGYILRKYGYWQGPTTPCHWATDADLVDNLANFLKEKKWEYLNLWWVRAEKQGTSK